MPATIAAPAFRYSPKMQPKIGSKARKPAQILHISFRRRHFLGRQSILRSILEKRLAIVRYNHWAFGEDFSWLQQQFHVNHIEPAPEFEADLLEMRDRYKTERCVQPYARLVF